VSETEFKITVPSTTLTPGKYTFVVKNAGGLAHDLVFEGPNVSGREGTPLIQPGGTAKVTVSLAKDYRRYKEIAERHGIEISARRVRTVIDQVTEEESEPTSVWRRGLEQTTAALLRQSGEAS